MIAGEAALDVAARLEREGNIRGARNVLAAAVRTGEVQAMVALGSNLLIHEPAMPGAGVDLLKSAAARGAAQASHLCAVIAAQDCGTADNWSIALDYLVLAAEQGSEDSRSELQLLAGDD